MALPARGDWTCRHSDSTPIPQRVYDKSTLTPHHGVMSESTNLPAPDQIAARMKSCRQELDALRRLYRVAVAARQADEARARRSQAAPLQVEAGRHA